MDPRLREQDQNAESSDQMHHGITNLHILSTRQNAACVHDSYGDLHVIADSPEKICSDLLILFCVVVAAFGGTQCVSRCHPAAAEQEGRDGLIAGARAKLGRSSGWMKRTLSSLNATTDSAIVQARSAGSRDLFKGCRCKWSFSIQRIRSFQCQARFVVLWK